MEELFTEKAAQMVIMDAIEKGHTDKAELIKYMATDEFKTAAKNYFEMFKATFA